MDLEEKIKKLESLAWLVAHVDGISEDEAYALDFLPGKIRGFYDFREAVEVFEKTGDLEQAMTHVESSLIFVTIMNFGRPEHIQEVISEVEALEGSETIIDDFKTLIKIRASEFDDEFDQKLFLGCILDVIDEDGTSDIEMHFFLGICRLWGITRSQANVWFTDYFSPVIDKADELYGLGNVDVIYDI
jgi:hypothetical protein